MFYVFLYAVGIFVVGLSIFPGMLLCFKIWQVSAALALIWKISILCFGVIVGYFLYGFSLILITGGLHALFHLHLKEGEYSPDSPEARKWILVNLFVMIVSNTFMDFILLTPVVNVFYRLMGAKLGRYVPINSKYCSDLSLLEIGDKSVIGGHATVIGHSFENGSLILKKVKIGKNAVIGLNAVVLPGTQIGDGATVAAGAVLLKNTIVEPGSLYAGVPAVSAKVIHASTL